MKGENVWFIPTFNYRINQSLVDTMTMKVIEDFLFLRWLRWHSQTSLMNLRKAWEQVKIDLNCSRILSLKNKVLIWRTQLKDNSKKSTYHTKSGWCDRIVEGSSVPFRYFCHVCKQKNLSKNWRNLKQKTK